MAKKKKKKSLSGDIAGSVKKTGSKVVSNVLLAVSVALGLGGGLFLLRKAPKTNIAFANGLVDKLLPGALAILGGYMLHQQESKYAKYAAYGLYGAGGVSVLVKLLSDRFPGLTDMLPNLSGLSGVSMQGISMQGVQGASAVNVGDFDVNYYRKNAFQGLAGDGFALSGSDGFALSGGAYALN